MRIDELDPASVVDVAWTVANKGAEDASGRSRPGWHQLPSAPHFKLSASLNPNPFFLTLSSFRPFLPLFVGLVLFFPVLSWYFVYSSFPLFSFPPFTPPFPTPTAKNQGWIAR
jgi:hypothetical protein